MCEDLSRIGWAGVDFRQAFDDLVRFETELWNALNARLVAESEITLGAFNVLLIVSDRPTCRVQDLAAALAITVGGVSQAVDRVEARGFLVRTPNPTNRRSSYLSITDSGRSALKRAVGIFDEELSIWFGAPAKGYSFTRFSADLAALRAANEARQAIL